MFYSPSFFAFEIAFLGLLVPGPEKAPWSRSRVVRTFLLVRRSFRLDWFQVFFQSIFWVDQEMSNVFVWVVELFRSAPAHNWLVLVIRFMSS